MSFILRRTQNTMKKSKIIVPALGLLLLSTAASVSGTVAWFTAVRSFNTSAGNFAVVKTNTDLICHLGAGIGTSVNNNGTADIYSDDTITLANNYVELADSSYDHANSYVTAPDGSGQNVGTSTALSKSTAASAVQRASYSDGANSHTVYSVVTWTMDFEVSYTVADADNALFLNTTSKFVNSSNDNEFAEDGTDAALGFRLAFIPVTESGDTDNVYENNAGAKLVFAGARTTTTSSVVKYIANSGSATGLLSSLATAYSDNLCLKGQGTMPNDGAVNLTTAEGYDNYLGKFTATAGKTMHLKYLVVGWFEGTDPNVQNGKTLANKVKASLSFEVRSLANA